MNRFWDKIILPIIQSIEANYIVEVGSDTGLNTRNILDYCKDNNTHMTAIDPAPSFDISSFKEEYGDTFEIYTELSLKKLPQLKDYDVILLDGDHNWYTLYNELKIIEDTFNKNFPIIFFHDISWPYGRRDLYYNPKTIPINYRHPYKKLGIYPGKSELNDDGINRHLYNTIYENTPKNGVLTAIEDFIIESNSEFYFEKINAYNGLGILFPKEKNLKKIIEKIIKRADFLSIVEDEKIKYALSNSKLKEENENLKKNCNEYENILRYAKEQLIQHENEIKQQEIKLKEFEKLKESFYAMKYFNGERPFKQKLISMFPSLYILMNAKKTGLKIAFTNIKGYRSIKKNKLLDIGYYLNNNADIRLSGMDPILNYIYYGFKEGRNPNPTFNSELYLNKFYDVKELNLNPLVHYSLYGIKEGRKITDFNKTEKKQQKFDINICNQSCFQGDFKSNQIITKYPKISVISSVYNKETSLYEYVTAFANQNYDGEIELVLVDDLSTDNSIEVLKCAQEIYKNKPNFEIKIITNEKNLGNCGSRNKGISFSKGEILVIIDADCIVNREFLKEHFKAHEKGFDICIGPMGIESKRRDINVLHEKLFENEKLLKAEMKLQYPQEPTGFMNCVTRNFSITKEFIKKMDETLFDESFSYSKNAESGFGWEDTEMGYRTYKKGAKVCFVNKAISIHKTHDPETPDSKKPKLSMKNFARLVKKHPEIIKIAPDWTFETFKKISDWLKKYDYDNNEDEIYLKSIFQQ